MEKTCILLPRWLNRADMQCPCLEGEVQGVQGVLPPALKKTWPREHQPGLGQSMRLFAATLWWASSGALLAVLLHWCISACSVVVVVAAKLKSFAGRH